MYFCNISIDIYVYVYIVLLIHETQTMQVELNIKLRFMLPKGKSTWNSLLIAVDAMIVTFGNILDLILLPSFWS